MRYRGIKLIPCSLESKRQLKALKITIKFPIFFLNGTKRVKKHGNSAAYIIKSNCACIKLNKGIVVVGII